MAGLYQGIASGLKKKWRLGCEGARLEALPLQNSTPAGFRKTADDVAGGQCVSGLPARLGL